MFELNNIHAIKIGIASPEKIRSWSHGEVTKSETINYRTQKPERDGLFCERIFGPKKDYECHCGKYKRIRYSGVICDKCGVEVTSSSVRRERMGHIELATPVSHIWFFSNEPSKIGTVLDLMTKDLESVLYYVNYIVIDPGQTDLVKKQILTDREFREAEEKYGEDSFKAGMGGEAIKTLLQQVDLQKECDELRKEVETCRGLKKAKLIKRLTVLDSFLNSNNKPEWMIMDCIPVLPPELRPMVQLDGGRFATNDLNDLYRRVINRNSRLKKLLELGAPDVIVRNEKRMLQEAVDSLFHNGKRGRKVIGGSKNRPLKSLTDSISGKTGRFRQNLLGKRVDYSGRAVIVIGPELKMYQCGLPKKMALELFKPFIMKRLIEDNDICNIKSAKRMVDREVPEVWDILDEVIKDHPVLLNRAPTLHKLGIQAFEPVLVEGNAIRLHPLVCKGFNADFDGDQMAVHVPLSLEARTEARFLMLSTNNIVKPSDGSPIVTPQQDIVLGAYYLTMIKKGDKGEGSVYRDENEALKSYQMKYVTLQAPIKVRKKFVEDGKDVYKIVDTTVGRIIFNQIIPQDIGLMDRTKEENKYKYEVDQVVGKDYLGKIVKAIYKKYSNTKTAMILDDIKSLGYKYSTLSGITMNLFDMTIPVEREQIIADTNKIVEANEKNYMRGLITLSEKVDKNIQIWNDATEKVKNAVKANLDEFNPLNIIAVSKARMNASQLNQVCGMRGIITSTSGQKIDIPIKSNYRLGLKPVEYFISARGGRKGLADTALKTADAGYFTRRLVDVAHDLIITEEDCFEAKGEKVKGLSVSAIYNDGALACSLATRIAGRYTAEDVIDPTTGEVLLGTNEYIEDEMAEKIEKLGIKEVSIRTALTCGCKHGICAKCFGRNLSTNRLVDVGEPVGIVSAQSVGEPGTQLTMKNFHTGGVATASDITTGLPRVEELFEAREPKGKAVISEVVGTVELTKEDKLDKVIIHTADGEVEYLIPYGSILKVKNGESVQPGTPLTKGSIYPNDILRTRGLKAVEEYLISEIIGIYASQSVDINPKYIECILRKMLTKVKIEEHGDTKFMDTETVDLSELEEENERVLEEGGRPALSKRILLGIRPASLRAHGFLSAASFQETSRVLTNSAVQGKVDYLEGIKENVIIGKLIPAGTGAKDYSHVMPKFVENEEFSPYTEVELDALNNDNNEQN